MKFLIALALLASVASAQTLEIPTIALWPDGAPGAVGTEDADQPTLFVYPASERKATGAAVVVCPGGGYGHLAMGHEGQDVAGWLNSFGVTAFVLRYRIAPRYGHPAPLQDAQRAIQIVRSRADEWGLDPERIGILGFSAGGHLASSASTHFEPENSESADPVGQVSSRPDFSILVYPVISLTTEYTHEGSKRNLLGENPPDSLARLMSSELQVTAETPPTLLVHTTEDTAVPPENSLLYYQALREAGVPAELHIYQAGHHGLGLAPETPSFSSWPDRARAWMHERGYLAPEE